MPLLRCVHALKESTSFQHKRRKGPMTSMTKLMKKSAFGNAVRMQLIIHAWIIAKLNKVSKNQEGLRLIIRKLCHVGKRRKRCRKQLAINVRKRDVMKLKLKRRRKVRQSLNPILSSRVMKVGLKRSSEGSVAKPMAESPPMSPGKPLKHARIQQMIHLQARTT